MRTVLAEDRHRRLLFGSLALLLVAWTITVFAVGPKQLVGSLGHTNGYLVAFLSACFGGVSSFTGATFLTAVAALAAGGLDPVGLGLVAGLGATLSDGFFYYLGHEARPLLPRWIHPRAERFSDWLRARPPWFVSVVVVAYTAFLPFPSDLLLVTLGLADVPLRRFGVPLLIGNCTFLIWFAYLAGRLSG